MELTKIPNNIGNKYKWKGNAKQRQAMSDWLTPSSGSFGNAYKSFKNAGFSESYSKNIVNVAPKWISEYIDRMNLTDDHVMAVAMELMLSAPNSKSPDDTRIKATELVGKMRGMIDNKQINNTINVQPILSEVIKDRIVIEQDIKTKDKELIDSE